MYMVIDLSQSPTYVGAFVLPPWFTVCVTAVGGKVGDRFGGIYVAWSVL